MNHPEILIKQAIHELDLKKGQSLDLYLEDGNYIKIAISDKGTPILFIKEPMKVEEWTGHGPFKRFMNNLNEEEDTE